MTAPTAADRERWDRQHVKAVTRRNVCRACGNAWPCPVRRLLDALVDAEAQKPWPLDVLHIPVCPKCQEPMVLNPERNNLALCVADHIYAAMGWQYQPLPPDGADLIPREPKTTEGDEG